MIDTEKCGSEISFGNWNFYCDRIKGHSNSHKASDYQISAGQTDNKFFSVEWEERKKV